MRRYALYRVPVLVLYFLGWMSQQLVGLPWHDFGHHPQTVYTPSDTDVVIKRRPSSCWPVGATVAPWSAGSSFKHRTGGLIPGSPLAMCPWERLNPKLLHSRSCDYGGSVAPPISVWMMSCSVKALWVVGRRQKRYRSTDLSTFTG